MKAHCNRTGQEPLTVTQTSAALLIAFALLQIGCTAPMMPAPPATEATTARSISAPLQNERPGLGTAWGEQRDSRVESTSFVRASRTRPLAVNKLFYNDDTGASAMLAGRDFRKKSGALTMDDRLVRIGLQDPSGHYLPSYQSGDDRIFVGKPGQRYTIVAENLSSSRLEFVISVDGLDVMDGKPGAYTKRGYVIDTGEKLRVAGFRNSSSSVAAFRFSSVRDSYAERRHGDARNVGVIGVAVFHEQGTHPEKWTRRERQRRMNANPFPEASRFATPPPAND
jgi:hypothetical protein